ncbi:MAG: hypothetical protein V1827_04725 [Candidatus Micrarchaeota archaeon]
MGEVRQLSEDKIRVDEPLISTDVDSLIRTLAEKKKLPLNELRQICRIDKKTLDKWIAVLEEEEYIQVEYGLRGTNIIWKGQEMDASMGDEAPPAPQAEAAEEDESGELVTKEEPASERSDDQLPLDTVPVKADDEERQADGKKEVNGDFTSVNPLDDEHEPEELLSEYLARKKTSDGDDPDSMKSSILSRMEENDGDTEGIDTSIVAGDDDQADEAEPSVVAVPESDEKSEAEEPTIRPTSRKRPPTADVRELMGSYMEEISKEKARIEALKEDKETLYRDKLATSEGKMQADIVAFTERIIETQAKIADLKEHVLELPDKVDELGRLQQQMEDLRSEGREALERTRGKAEDFISRLGESKAEVEGRLSQASSGLEAQSGKLKELERVSSSLDARTGKLKSALDAAKAQAEDITSAISSLNTDMAQIEKAKADLNSETGSVKATVAERGAELQSLQEELEGIGKLEHWVTEYVRDYENKIEDIEQYVEKSEDEMADLREAAESLYLKKYLSEIESLTESYQNDLEDTVAKEKDIDQRIAEARDRIAALAKESQEMVRKLRSGSSGASEKDFGILVAKVKARAARAKSMVEEKQAERAKLADESSRTRKTVAPKGAKPIKMAKKAARGISKSKKRR